MLPAGTAVELKKPRPISQSRLISATLCSCPDDHAILEPHSGSNVHCLSDRDTSLGAHHTRRSFNCESMVFAVDDLGLPSVPFVWTIPDPNWRGRSRIRKTAGRVGFNRALCVHPQSHVSRPFDFSHRPDVQLSIVARRSDHDRGGSLVSHRVLK